MTVLSTNGPTRISEDGEPRLVPVLTRERRMEFCSAQGSG